MKKIFACLVFAGSMIVFAPCAFANHIAPPQIPGAEYFVSEGVFACGELLAVRLAYLTKEETKDKEIKDVLWVKYILLAGQYAENENINPFAISKLTFGAFTEHWIDFDIVFMRADGHFDEYFSSTQELILKYKKPCDIIKK